MFVILEKEDLIAIEGGYHTFSEWLLEILSQNRNPFYAYLEYDYDDYPLHHCHSDRVWSG